MSGARQARPSIFVQIASYRDPELAHTIADCVANAASPERLSFGICWQRDPSESLPCAGSRGVRVVEVPYQESRGVCWARRAIQALYDGEDYTLQLDSHHRFVPGWDEQCLALMDGLRSRGVARPLLTTYAPSYDPQTDPDGRAQAAWKITFDKFAPSGGLVQRPAVMRSAEQGAGPLPARFLSAHFAFADGRFCLDVPYDEQLYFHGEEIDVAVRAFTKGYDLFHPDRIIVWHEYSRNYRRKHWDDHPDWWMADARSQERVRQRLAVEEAEPSARSVRDYERYAGISFRQRAVEQYTLEDRPPPNPSPFETDAEWTPSLCVPRQYTVSLNPDEMPACEDCDFWFVGAHDPAGLEIHRQDVAEEEIRRIDRSRPWSKRMEFLAGCEPDSWTVWAHSRSAGWLRKITKRVER